VIKCLPIALISLLSIFVTSCNSSAFLTIKNTIETKAVSVNIGIVQGIYIGICESKPGACLYVLIQPINAEADKAYIVSLYEKGQLRQKNTVSWNQPEINVHKAKYVLFDATSEEYSAYVDEYCVPNLFTSSMGHYPKSLSFVFSVTIAPQEPVSLITYRDFSVTNYSVYPDIVGVNQPVTIKCDVINHSEETGEYTVIFRINGEIEKKVTATIDGKCTYPISFTVTRSNIGSYIIDFSGQFKGVEYSLGSNMFVVK
jgi:hypothetical protein